MQIPRKDECRKFLNRRYTVRRIKRVRVSSKQGESSRETHLFLAGATHPPRKVSS